MASAAHILKPYTQRVEDNWVRLRRAGVLFVVLLYAVFMGLAIVVLPTSLLMVPFLPVLVLGAVAIWAIPEAEVDVDRTMRRAMLAFLFTMSVWPTYMAINLPGLPWITPGRIAMGVLLAAMLYGTSQSPALRAAVLDRFKSVPLLAKLFLCWIAVQALTIVLAPNTTGAASKWLYNQVYWTFMVIAGAYVLSLDGMGLKLRKAMNWAMVVIVGVMLPELYYQQPVWTPYIPGWLQGDPELFATAMAPQARTADGLYRARSIFTVSLYCAEYLALVTPFVVHGVVKAKDNWRRSLMILVFLMTIVACWTTNNRTSMIGLLTSILFYGLWWTWKRMRLGAKTRDLVGPFVALSYVAVAGAFIAAVLLWRRLYVKVIGGGQHQASNDTRGVQFDMMWPKLRSNPIGHGPNQALEVIGYVGRGDRLSLDSHVINLLIDYGVLGFAIFVAMFITACVFGVRAYLHAEDDNDEAVLPATCLLINFLIAKMVVSWDYNHYLAYAMMGFVFAIRYRQKMRLGTLHRPARPGVLARGA